jgi:hypothetical protein
MPFLRYQSLQVLHFFGLDLHLQVCFTLTAFLAWQSVELPQSALLVATVVSLTMVSLSLCANAGDKAIMLVAATTESMPVNFEKVMIAPHFKSA